MGRAPHDPKVRKKARMPVSKKEKGQFIFIPQVLLDTLTKYEVRFMSKIATNKELIRVFFLDRHGQILRPGDKCQVTLDHSYFYEGTIKFNGYWFSVVFKDKKGVKCVLPLVPGKARMAQMTHKIMGRSRCFLDINKIDTNLEEALKK